MKSRTGNLGILLKLTTISLLILSTIGSSSPQESRSVTSSKTAATTESSEQQQQEQQQTEILSGATTTTSSSSNNSGSSGKESTASKKSPTKVISLAESINRSQKVLQDPERVKASREEWKRALQEIKELAVDLSNAPRVAKGTPPPAGGVFSQWKLLLDVPTRVELDPETNITTAKTQEDSENESDDTNDVEARKSVRKRIEMPRFEGFNSWERMMQDWADDIQEYMDKIEAETTEYPLSTHGAPSPRKDQAPKDVTVDSDKKTVQIVEEKSVEVELPAETFTKKKAIALPVPAAAKDGEPVLPHTDLADKSKRILIVTTASLPWMTGTAVNPLLRAAYMTRGRKEAGGSVTLMLPWLERSQDQEQVYGDSKRFASPADQEEFVRSWLREKAKLIEESENIKFEWYTAWQNKAENSIYSMGDITALIPAEEVDICILEEPEHLNWYRAPGESWTDKFEHVVGIIHTNYFVYAQEQPAAFIRAPGMRLLCSWMCRAHCHRIIKLSGTLGRFAPEKELVENVHGVRPSFLVTGEEVRQRLKSPTASSDPIFSATAEPSVYFIGKMLWSKGLSSLMELLKYAEESAGISVHVDMYGGGPDKDAAEQKAKSLDVDMEFHGYIDHGDLALTHKIFINPSTSEVLCTTVAEALAMGKFVVVPSHPSNDFFAQFPNCLTYTSKEEFVGVLYYALTHAPEPLSKEASHALSWEAATERLEAAGCIPVKEAELMEQALSSNDAGIEISLPLRIEDKERRLLASTLRRSRNRYRQFRSRLSQEISQSNVLPSGVKQRLVNELDKRLDLDIEQVLETPRLRLQLSPAELDKRLLELYKNISEGPSGDVLRIIGGGNEVALQDLYLKKQASKKRATDPNSGRGRLSFGPLQAWGEDSDERKRTASQWVNLALRRNLPKNGFRRGEGVTTSTAAANSDDNNNSNNKNKMTMSIMNQFRSSSSTYNGPHMPQIVAMPSSGQFCPTLSRKTHTLLI